MKTLVNKFFGLMFLACVSIGTANALPTVWVDSYDPIDFKLSAPYSFVVSHDITDGVNGYRPGIDTITNASLFINLYDDLDLFTPEKVSFNFDGSGWTSPTGVGGSFLWADTFAFNVTSLLHDGLLNFTVKATEGDFYFADALLVVEGSRASVPEPMSIAVFGIGLLALGFAVAKRGRSKTLSL